MSSGGPDSNGRITVSEDTLRRVLAEFKLELVKELQQYATAASLAAIDLRVNALELTQARESGADRSSDRFSDRTLAYAALVVAAIGAIGSLLLNH